MGNKYKNLLSLGALVLIIVIVSQFINACSDDQAKEIKERIKEKYGDSIGSIYMEKDWKSSEPDHTEYDIYAQIGNGTSTFRISQDTLHNNYNYIHWLQWMEKEALQIARKYFGMSVRVYVNIVGGWTDTIPGVDPIIPYEEFMQTYCDNSGGRTPGNMIQLEFSSNHSNSNYQAFLEEFAKSDLIFDTLFLVCDDNYEVKFTYDEVQMLAENYDEAVVESLTYKFEP
ncbi:MAG: hypothetical protein IKV98_02510 [Clostridia bacterium]|nr:hypothetical protein [Clostridia bacterium]